MFGPALLVCGPVLVGLGLGAWFKRWRVVGILILIGVAVSVAGWRADWFADVNTGGDFTAGGGALVFWLIICLPLAVGAALGVVLMRSEARARPEHSSTLPVVPPPGSERGLPNGHHNRWSHGSRTRHSRGGR